MFVAVEPAGQVRLSDPGLLGRRSCLCHRSRDGGLDARSPARPYSTGTWPVFIAFDPTGKFVYVANRDSLSISAYAINSSTGALSAVPGSPFTAEEWPASIATIRIEQ